MFDIGFADLSVPAHLQIAPPININPVTQKLNKYIKKKTKKRRGIDRSPLFKAQRKASTTGSGLCCEVGPSVLIWMMTMNTALDMLSKPNATHK